MCFYTEKILKTSLLPWRLRHSLEKWTETTARIKYPALYNLLYFGRTRDIVKAVTQGPSHHFFGYYDKSPWNKSGTLLLAHEADFNDHPPNAGETVTIGVIHLNDNNRFQPLAETHAWNWQQGAMPQWHPLDPEKLFLYNDRRTDKFVGMVRDINGKEVTVYNRPIYAVTPDGKQGYSLNFARLHKHRPGYGYTGVADPWHNDPQPDDDGIYSVDLKSGESRLIFSLQQLARLNAKPEMLNVYHWVNHIQVSRNGKRFAFFHIWRTGKTGWSVRLYTADRDGSGLHCLLDTEMISHYDWLGDEKILVWAKWPDRGNRFLLCDVPSGEVQIIGEELLTEDGHCSFSPDSQWVLNDTYPDVYNMRTLMLYKWNNNQRIDIARLYSPKERWWGEIRCDLHPRWNRDGRQVCIDSVHSGGRQMYVIDVEKIVS